MARKDIHRPSALVVEDYDFIKFDYLPSDGDVLGSAMFLAAERAKFMAHMEKTGARYGENHSAGSCYICGARAIYTATFYHEKTNSYIHTGLECAEALDCGDAAAFRKKVKVGLEAVAGKRKAKAILEKAGLVAAWELNESDIAKRAEFAVEYKAWRDANPEPEYVSSGGGYGIDEVGAPKFKEWSRDEYTVLDMVRKLVKYGSMSEKQEGFMKSLLGRIANRPAIEAARAAEVEAAAPVPVFEGRMTVVGKVLTVKEQESQFGIQTKMLVQHESGWKVWSTVPSAILDGLNKGDVIEFVAKVTVSDNDPKFGYANRPAQARVVKAVEKEVAA